MDRRQCRRPRGSSVAAERAIRNGQRSGAKDPAAKARGKWISNTSDVVAHGAIGDHERPAVVEDASAVRPSQTP